MAVISVVSFITLALIVCGALFSRKINECILGQLFVIRSTFSSGGCMTMVGVLRNVLDIRRGPEVFRGFALTTAGLTVTVVKCGSSTIFGLGLTPLGLENKLAISFARSLYDRDFFKELLHLDFPISMLILRSTVVLLRAGLPIAEWLPTACGYNKETNNTTTKHNKIKNNKTNY